MLTAPWSNMFINLFCQSSNPFERDSEVLDAIENIKDTIENLEDKLRTSAEKSEAEIEDQVYRSITLQVYNL